MNEDAPRFKPSNRTSSWAPRILMPWDECTDCMKRRNDGMAKYRLLRKELSENFKLINGKDVGMTIGIGLRSGFVIWKEVLIMI